MLTNETLPDAVGAQVERGVGPQATHVPETRFGKMPQGAVYTRALGTVGAAMYTYTADQMRAYLAEGVAAERERLLSALTLMGSAALDAVRDDWTAGYARGIGACEEIIRRPSAPGPAPGCAPGEG